MYTKMHSKLYPLRPIVLIFVSTLALFALTFVAASSALALPALQGDAAPDIDTTSPLDNAIDVPATSDIVITFTEDVTVTDPNAFDLDCSTSSDLVFTLDTSGPATVFTLNPTDDLPLGDDCVLTVLAAEISDVDGDDPPINMTADYILDFTVAAAEFDVMYGLDEIVNGSGANDFGSPFTGSPVVHEFDLQNNGEADLSIGTIDIPVGFSITQPYANTLEKDTFTVLTLQCDASSSGTFSGTISISNNDPDEDPYEFTVTCTVIDPEPELDVRDAQNLNMIPDGGGPVNIGATPVGTPITYEFDVMNNGDTDLTIGSITVSSGFSITQPYATTLEKDTFTVLTVQCDATSSGTFNGTVSIPNDDSDEAPYNFTISCTVNPPPPVPEIIILTIPDGGSTSFGSTAIGTPVTRTFTIENLGAADLTIGAITVPAGFTVTMNPTSPVTASGSTDFNLRCNALSTGTFSGTVSIPNNDSTDNENPYEFFVTCTVNSGMVIQPPFLPEGYVKTHYGQSFSVSGGTGPFTFSRIGGTFPDGLSLNRSTGELSGIPTVKGIFYFTIQATGSSGSVSQDYTLEIFGELQWPLTTKPCIDETHTRISVVRVALPDDFRNHIWCRIMVYNGRFPAYKGTPVYHWGNVGNRPLIDMGILHAVDVFSPTGVREVHDIVFCLRGSGKIYVLTDTFSTAPRTPVEAKDTYRVKEWPGFLCVTLYHPATVVMVQVPRTSATAVPGAASAIALTDCKVYLRYTLRLRAEPNMNSAILANVQFDVYLVATQTVPGWYKVKYRKLEGWLKEEFLLLFGNCKPK